MQYDFFVNDRYIGSASEEVIRNSTSAELWDKVEDLLSDAMHRKIDLDGSSK